MGLSSSDVDTFDECWKSIFQLQGGLLLMIDVDEQFLCWILVLALILADSHRVHFLVFWFSPALFVSSIASPIVSFLVLL